QRSHEAQQIELHANLSRLAFVSFPISPHTTWRRDIHEEVTHAASSSSLFGASVSTSTRAFVVRNFPTSAKRQGRGYGPDSGLARRSAARCQDCARTRWSNRGVGRAGRIHSERRRKRHVHGHRILCRTADLHRPTRSESRELDSR